MASRKQKPTIREPSPAFFGWSVAVGFLIVTAVMVCRVWLGNQLRGSAANLFQLPSLMVVDQLAQRRLIELV
jgi:hypothetical protein